MTSSKKLRSARLAVAVIAFVCGASIGSSAFSADSFMPDRANLSYGPLVFADAHPYRHCHNLSKKTYCHKADRLPQNWPPNSNTPHRSGYETNTQTNCPAGSKHCAKNGQYRKG